jgi:ferredoxin
MENQQLVSPSRQHSSKPSVLVKDFLAKHKVTTLEHPPKLSCTGCGGCVPVSSTETNIEGWRFSDATDIINNATEELKRLSKNCFQEYF